MTITRVLVLGVVVLTVATGCASGIDSASAPDPSLRGDGAGSGSSPALQHPILDCRNRGVYSRAANLCVSEGP